MILGIYKIENRINKKKYIGSSIDVLGRWECHKSMLKNGNHDNEHLQRSWNKYGGENFQFNILEWDVEGEDLLKREDAWMIAYQSIKNGYNMKTAERQVLTEKIKKRISEKATGRKHTKETCQKLSKIKKELWKNPQYRKKVIEANKNRFDDKLKEKMSKLSKERWKDPNYRKRREYLQGENHPCYGKTHSEETKKKISESNIKRWAAADEARKNLAALHKKNNPIYSNTKWCWKCLTEKPKNKFSKNRKKRDGLDCKCKQCDKERKTRRTING